ncbi:hypothetical protein LguiA_006926 [Lonicera macranthoides]
MKFPHLVIQDLLSFCLRRKFKEEGIPLAPEEMPCQLPSPYQSRLEFLYAYLTDEILYKEKTGNFLC